MTPPLCKPIKQIKHPICFADSTSSKSQLHINHNLDTFLWWIFKLYHKLHNHSESELENKAKFKQFRQRNSSDYQNIEKLFLTD